MMQNIPHVNDQINFSYTYSCFTYRLICNELKYCCSNFLLLSGPINHDSIVSIYGISIICKLNFVCISSKTLIRQVRINTS